MTNKNILARVILHIRNKPENQTYLFKDADTYVLRNIYFNGTEPKSRSIPLSAAELVYIAEFVKTQAFQDMIDE